MTKLGAVVEGGHTGEHASFEELERGTTTGRNMADFVSQTHLLDSGH